MKANPLLHLACLASALAAAGCSRSQDQVTFDLRRPSQGTPVATYNGGVITVEDVNKAVGQLPPMLRMRYQTPAAKKEFIERLITLDLLARNAVATGHAKDPEVVESVKNVLAQRVVKEARDKQAPAVSEEEVKAWYDGHTQDFIRPETWRVSTLLLAIPPGDAAKKTAQDAKAAKLLAQAQVLVARCNASASCGQSGRPSAPSVARRTRPYLIRSSATRRAVLMGIAKAMPAVVELGA